MSITQERLKELLHYDPETGVFTWLVRRGGGVKAGNKAGYKSNGYLRVSIDGKAYLMHRLAWLYIYAVLPPAGIDHINGGRDDNRLINLRCATRSENGQNLRKARAGSAINLLGVTPWKGKYKAQIMLNGVKHYLGLHPTIEEAHAAYLEAKRKLHPYGTL